MPPFFGPSYPREAVLMRRGFCLYKVVLMAALLGVALTVVSLIASGHSASSAKLHDSSIGAKVHPAFGYDSPARLFSTDWFSRPFESANESAFGKMSNFARDSILATSAAPYEIKSCLSPDLLIHEKATCRFHAVMMDAGSTGTRVHIFEFSHDTNNNNAPFKLEKETFTRVSPGLSHYLNDVKQAAASVLPLLKKAMKTVSKSQWRNTPIALKATAGLRLLDERRAEAIINEVDKLLDDSGFLTNEDSVQVMTGIDEGIFGWFTLNFLLDRLSFLKQEPLDKIYLQSPTLIKPKMTTAAALDLGGGSTQITFRPELNQTLVEAPDNFIRQLRLFSRSYDLYTHSYLGNGLMASRLETLRLASENANRSVYSINNTVFTTSCLPPSYSLTWQYNGVVYNVSGLSNYDFDNCVEEQKKFLAKSQIHDPIELRFRDVYLFGYFFDRARQAGLTGSNGAYINVGDLIRVSRKACSRRKLSSKDEDRWKCRDLAYISSLLKSYGLPDDKKVFLTKKLRNMEVSWALGASYHLLNTYHETRRRDGDAASPVISQRSSPNSISQRLLDSLSQRSPNSISQRSSIPATGTPPCNDVTGLSQPSAAAGVWPVGHLINVTAAFLCTRVYYGLIGLLAATAQLA